MNLYNFLVFNFLSYVGLVFIDLFKVIFSNSTQYTSRLYIEYIFIVLLRAEFDQNKLLYVYKKWYKGYLEIKSACFAITQMVQHII